MGGLWDFLVENAQGVASQFIINTREKKDLFFVLFSYPENNNL